MANDKDFKVGTSIKPKRYLEALGTISSTPTSFDLANTSFSNKSLDTSGQISGERGVALSADGTKIFVVDGASGDDINEYALSTAFDVSTASFTDSFSLSSQTNQPSDLHFKPDGTSFFISDRSTEDIFQYNMTSAFDVSTASYANKSFAQAQDTNICGLTFSSDGTKMYIGGLINDEIFQYSLSSAFDVSTASYDSVSLDISSQSSAAFSITFNNDGTKLFVLDNTEFIFQYNLSTAFNLSTASYSNISHQLTEDTSQNKALTFSADGTKMYVTGTSVGKVFQYSTSVNINSLDLSTGSVFNLTPTSSSRVDLTNPAASGTNSGATLLLAGSVASSFDLANTVDDNVSLAITEGDLRSLTMSNSGTKLYIGSATNNSVYQYSLSTAYDATTATYDSVSFDHSSQATNFQGLAFKPDGTKMFGSTASNMYQYSLSTPFNVSTASYDSVSFSHGRTTSEMVFKPDGTRFFITDAQSDDVRQFDLSSAWDLSTASYNNVLFDLSNQDSKPFGLAFNNDGTKMFMAGDTNNSVFQYSLSTAWTVSSASYDNVSYDYGSATESSVFFNNSGTKMFIAEEGGDEDIRRFTVGSGSTITYNSSIKFSGGTAPTSPEVGETDVITFDTTDGGTTYLASHAIDGAK